MSPIMISLSLLMLFAAGGPASAAGKASHVIGKITVTDGYGVHGVAGGVLFAREFDRRCQLTALHPAEKDRPFAGSVKKKTRLHVAVSTISCPAAAAHPPVHCSWAVAGTPLAGEATWTGPQGGFVLTVPERTGIYRASISCRLEGPSRGPLDVVRTLYVTHDDPQVAAGDREQSSPEIDWYRRACSWGAGFGAEAKDSEILKKMLAGLWEYGKSHWKYGYFPDDEAGSEIFAPKCLIEGGEPWCHCTWQALVRENTPCRYANCNQFTEVFEHMAETLGLGGFKSVRVVGSEAAGFAVRPGSVSFDVNFRTNVKCEDRSPACPPYLFGSHSLRLRDGIYYDPTFNQVYEKETDIIAMNVCLYGRIVTFMESPLVMCYQGGGYGDWWYYLRPSAGGSSPPDSDRCPLDATRPARFSGRVQFSHAVAEEGLNPVAVEVEVEIRTTGRYGVSGFLFSDWKSQRRGPDPPRYAAAALGGNPGTQQVRLLFPDADSVCRRIDGPYQLHLTLYSRDGKVETLVKELPASAGPP